jgi:hypothetical protein
VDVVIEIVHGAVPSFQSLKDLRESGVELSIQRKSLLLSGKEQPLHLENGFLVQKWEENEALALFTEDQLRKLHRSFGHPTAGSLYRLLKGARPDKASSSVRDAIYELTKACNVCLARERQPRRFKLTIGAEDLRFNSVIAADVMYIRNEPVLHVVDEATHFAAASWLKAMTARETWDTLLRCWSHVYMGPPDLLRVDQGSNFASKDFRSLAAAATFSF